MYTKSSDTSPLFTKTGAVTTYMDEKVIVRYNEDQHLPVCYVSYNMRVPFLQHFSQDLYFPPDELRLD